MRRSSACGLILVGLLGFPACKPPSEPPSTALHSEAWIEDATEKMKLTFVHDVGPERTFFMPEMMAPGSALLDYDLDGDLDLYLVNSGPAPGVDSNPAPTNRLYRQESDGTFLDVTAESGLGDTGYGQGVAVGDYDNDGLPDLYVTNYGANALYRNRGDGRFENRTGTAGVGDPGWGTSATFLDYDADGWLDLFVANYVELDPAYVCHDRAGRSEFCGPDEFPGAPDRLYRNRGDGTFSDVSQSSGIGLVGHTGLGVAAADLDGDARIDIYVANDQQANQLWINQGDGTFRDDGLMFGVAFNQGGAAESSMGVVCDDLDGDLDLDLFVTHLRGETNTAYRNSGGTMFEDSTAEMGLVDSSVRFTGFGVGSLDIEHDGDLDLVLANGQVARGTPEPGAELGDFWNQYGQPGQLLLNDGNGRFTDGIEHAGRFGVDPQVGRGLSVGDLDGDGDLDFIANNAAGRARVFLNVAPKEGHWLKVRARDPELNRDAYGALVTLIFGEQRRLRQINPGYSYLSSSDPVAHFGVDAERYDAIEVTWPGGVTERFPGGETDRAVTLKRGGS